MTNLWKAVIAGGVFGAFVLIFSLFGKEEVKQEQRVQEATQQLHEQKFEDEFSDAWNGEPGSKIKKQRSENVAELKREVALAKAKRDDLDKFFDEATSSAKEAIHDEDARLGAAEDARLSDKATSRGAEAKVAKTGVK